MISVPSLAISPLNAKTTVRVVGDEVGGEKFVGTVEYFIFKVKYRQPVTRAISRRPVRTKDDVKGGVMRQKTQNSLERAA